MQNIREVLEMILEEFEEEGKSYLKTISVNTP